MIAQLFKQGSEVTPSSLVEHLAKAICLSRWPEGWFGVFSAYFDASGFEETEFVTVAGFIAHVSVWSEFEVAWQKRLREDQLFGKDGTPEFHMSECANRTYGYEKYRTDEPKRQRLLYDLAELLKMLGRKSACTLNVAQFRNKLEADIRDRFDLSAAYVLGGRACAARVKEWCWKDGVPHLSQVQFFFEEGDGKNIQANLHHRFLEDGYPTPIFKYKRNRYTKNGLLIEPGLIPFQAADVLAYLLNLDAKYSGRDWRDKESIRWMLYELSSIPEPPIVFNDELLDGLNSYLRAASVNLLPGSNET